MGPSHRIIEEADGLSSSTNFLLKPTTTAGLGVLTWIQSMGARVGSEDVTVMDWG